MDVGFGKPDEIDSWMDLVRKVRLEFPGLETEAGLAEHRETVLKFMRRNTAIRARDKGRITGMLLFSAKRNTLCCLAVDPQERGRGVAGEMFSLMLTVADRSRDITVTTFREGDPKGAAPRAFYKNLGFAEAGLTEEFGYPCQQFILRPRDMA